MERYFLAGSAQNIQHYDCRPYNFSSDDLARRGTRHVFLGGVVILFGVIIEVFYALAMMAMFSPNLRRFSCYKIMIVLAFYDIVATAIISFLTGYFLIVGAWYCTHPNLIYITGSCSLGFWAGSCFTCFVLVINRLLNMWRPDLMKKASLAPGKDIINIDLKLFGGNRVFLVLLIPFAYCLYFVLFTTAPLFNSRWMTVLFDPMINENPDNDQIFNNYPYMANNIVIVSATCILYSLFISIIRKKGKQVQQETAKFHNIKLKIIAQTTAICLTNFITAMMYMYIVWISAHQWLVVFGQFLWQLCHAMPAFVYLLMNKTIQSELKRIFSQGGHPSGNAIAIQETAAKTKVSNQQQFATTVV